MILYGREIKFKRTVGATIEIARICPGGDIRKIDELLNSDDVSKIMMASAQMLIALNRGYETMMHAQDQTYEMHPLTIDEVLALENEDFTALQNEAFDAFRNDAKTSINTVPLKKTDDNQ